ncbi:MAG: multifunctional 2',3'-cyclic-nucleotide 2'-phosphodiesterase/5'-nucleotidase/3'-nucleotidase [Hyphomicrobiales bacterium]|nr:MAG: multifunctional 2',3'-cyclic-nucleotide 2'-phosphodiesterase/5'-nucleotidase/3'-nucleotidase [Hyphomicrobiales bacterium]
MKKLIGLTAAGLLALGGAAQADYSLRVLHTNDFHSRVEPISKYDSGCSEENNAEGKCFGGYARMVSGVAAARASSNNSILVDGGDQFQGSLFYTYYKGKLAAEMMNKLGYDGMTVGNHEFDDGPEVLAGFMDAVSFPVLMSNADVSNEPALNGKLRRSIIIERGGEKIGLIGLTPQDTDELSSPGKNVIFIDPISAATREVAVLQAQGVNKIIVLSHSGYAVDMDVAAKVAGIDVIVGGHSNTYLSNTSDRAAGPYPTMIEGPDGSPTAVVQAYAYGKYLGALDVTFDDAGLITAATGEPIVMDGDVAEDVSTKTRIAELAMPLDEIRNKIVSESAAVIEGNREICRVEECEMGNLVADAMLDRVADQGIQIAIANSGGLRASIDAGPVTMGEVLTVLPFQNTLSTFHLKGSDVIAALENGVSQVEEVKGRFPQVAGIKFVWDMSVAANEGRIKSVEVMDNGSWGPIDPNKTYGLVSNNYVRGGGDGYKVFATNSMNVYDYGPGLENVVADYMAANLPYQPYTDGRISRVPTN